MLVKYYYNAIWLYYYINIGPAELVYREFAFFYIKGRKRRREEKKGSERLPKPPQSFPKASQRLHSSSDLNRLKCFRQFKSEGSKYPSDLNCLKCFRRIKSEPLWSLWEALGKLWGGFGSLSETFFSSRLLFLFYI